MRTREQVTDEILVLTAQAGSAEAFERLALRWHSRLLRYAMRLTADLEGAREAVQESWMAIAHGLRRLKDPACFGAWAFRIVSRRCADWIRRRQLARKRTDGLESAGQVAMPAREPSDDLERLQDVLRRIDPAQRFLVAKFYGESLSVSEIASILDIPAGTVKSRLFAARERIREALEVQNGETIQRG